MKVLYVSNTISHSKFKECFELTNGQIKQQGQKFHLLMMEGIALNEYEIHSLSILPNITQIEMTKEGLLSNETENSVSYHYITRSSSKVFSRIINFFRMFWASYKLLKPKDSVLVTDILSYSNSFASLFAAVLRKRTRIAIITDFPRFFQNRNNVVFLLFNILVRMSSAYVVLTKYMIDKLPPTKKSMIIEGLINNIHDKNSRLMKKNTSIRNCIYAGSIKKEFGLDILIDAFNSDELINKNLNIYGSGDYMDQVLDKIKHSKNIKFYGEVHNDIMITKLLSADLLINPRPSIGEFTYYSFPSKILEYMSTGVPLLTTNLPGMPKDLVDYCFLIQDETAEGIVKSVIELDKIEIQDYIDFGHRAQNYVNTNKNKKVQARKMMDFINALSSVRRNHGKV